MKTIKKINCVVAPLVIAAMMMFTSSCKREHFENEGCENEKHIPLAPWQMVSSGVSTSQRGIIEMSAAEQTTCYGIIFDESNYYNFLHDITFTHDGGRTWHAQTIAGLENNWLNGVAATTENTVHTIAANVVNGGGNVFRSKDGGNTWQREATNAFTDPASFPDVIKFFDPQHGVIFGDPVNGYFEIYTTRDGGNSWSRVPSNQIPALLTNESGITFFADTYLNTIWMITVTRENGVGQILSARLLQSDDKGEHWYVRNSSMPFNFSGDNLIKFRNKSVGLYKENAILFRTTDGGTTWNKVNYSGTWFSHGIDNVPGKEGWWISTGGMDNFFFPSNSIKGIGSSISYDDGNHWITIDTAVNHTVLEITSPTHGYSGGITSGTGNDGVFVYQQCNDKFINLTQH